MLVERLVGISRAGQTFDYPNPPPRASNRRPYCLPQNTSTLVHRWSLSAAGHKSAVQPSGEEKGSRSAGACQTFPPAAWVLGISRNLRPQKHSSCRGLRASDQIRRTQLGWSSGGAWRWLRCREILAARVSGTVQDSWPVCDNSPNGLRPPAAGEKGAATSTYSWRSSAGGTVFGTGANVAGTGTIGGALFVPDSGTGAGITAGTKVSESSSGRITMAIRRFFARPSAVVFSATG